MKSFNRFYSRAQNFLLAERDPRPLAITRILIGLGLSLQAIAYIYSSSQFFATDSLVNLRTALAYAEGSLFRFLIRAINWDFILPLLLPAHLILCIAVLLGAWTRVTTILALITITILQVRNPVILYFADDLSRWILLFGLVANWGSAYSLDKMRNAELKAGPKWPEFLMMITTTFIYIQQIYYKLQGAPWRDGTAVYYVLRREGMLNFPWPSFLDFLAFLKFATYATLFIQFLLAGPVWIPNRNWRRAVVILGITLHLAIEYSLTLPFGEWFMIGLLLLWWPWNPCRPKVRSAS